MNLQQGIQSRASASGFNRRRFDRESGTRTGKINPGKSGSSGFLNTVNGGKAVTASSPSRDRLMYVSSCFVGLPVEVHVRNGSIFSGIFYTVNTKDFGIVLRMAQIVKDGSERGLKGTAEATKRPRTMIIPAREFVQVIAKDVPLTTDEFLDAHGHDKRKDLMIDSVISCSHNIEVERELERWTPDADDPDCPELDNIFDGTWNRNWDQFETNATLFGVKSTFNEELYTTKLERGPQTTALERKASRIAREIEGEETHDIHLAEERGINFVVGFDVDEESRYSAVRRQIDDGIFEDNEDLLLDTCNAETFGGSMISESQRSYSNISREKTFDKANPSSASSAVDVEGIYHARTYKDKNVYGPSTNYQTSSSTSDHTKKSLNTDNESRFADKTNKDQKEKESFLDNHIDKVPVEAHTSKENDEKLSADEKGLSSSDIDPNPPSSNTAEDNSGQSSKPANSSKMPDCSGLVNQHPDASTSFNSGLVVSGSVSRGPSLSPSSSMVSLSSEKSILNPNAKEFKLNPNAKSFTPSVAMSEGSFYYTGSLPAVPPMQSLPGASMGPSFGAPVYNPQAAQLQMPQSYIHPGGPLYGQQMILGQPRPFYYMPPAYLPDMQYRGSIRH